MSFCLPEVETIKKNYKLAFCGPFFKMTAMDKTSPQTYWRHVW